MRMLVFAGKQNGRSHRETHEARTSTKKKKKNTTDTYHQIQESNPNHSGGRLTFSPLRLPRSENRRSAR